MPHGVASKNESDPPARSLASLREDLRLFKRFFSYMKPYKAPLRSVYALFFINSFLNLLPGASLWYYFDLVVSPKPVHVLGFTLDSTEAVKTPHDKVFWSLVYFFSVLLVIVVANSVGVLMWRVGAKVTQRMLLDVKTHIVHHLHKLSLSYFQRERAGSIMTRAVGDVGQMQEMLMNSFFLMYQVVQLFISPFFMILMSPFLFLFALIPLPVVVWVVYRMRYILRPLYKQQRVRQERIDSAFQEQISGMKEIKAFGQEDAAIREVRRAHIAYVESINQAMRVFSLNHQTHFGTIQMASVILGTAGGIMIATGTGSVSLGMIVSFLPLLNSFFNPFTAILGQYDVIQRGLTGMERVFAFLDIEPDIQNDPQAKWVDIKRGEVKFEHVSFGYDPALPVLHDVSFEAMPGKTVALVGSTGSGKSTLISLVPRFYDPQSGRILIDGHDIRYVKMEAIRRAVGIVFQETFLFYGSIAQNIAFSRQSATREEIVEAAKLARIHDFIEGLPEGYDTLVGERGVKLSGGQRQRLAIARMILKDPAIIILDEATSSLDATTEELIKESLEALMRNRTSFVIAHRLSTIRKADCIFVLEKGRIIERGSHQELLDAGGRYAELVSAS